MSRIDFHPQAAQGINTRGEALLSKVGKVARGPERKSFASQRVPHAVFTESDIAGGVLLQSVDELRNIVTDVRFASQGGHVGLEGEAPGELNKLCQLALKYLSAQAKVSDRLVRDSVIEWLQRKFRHEIDDTLSNFIAAKVSDGVAKRTILIPIANLCLEEDLPFGPIDFKVVSAKLMESWYESYKSSCPPDQEASLEAWFDRMRKDTQGLAAVSLTIEADEIFAIAMCLEKAEQAVALLRVLHPVNSSPHTALFVRPLGSESIESYCAYRYKNGCFEGERKEVRWPFPSFWEIPKDMYNDKSMQIVIDLFASQERSDFQQRLFDALLIYSRNNISREPAEKLIFCLVAVESMLLRNASEPIQDNIGERMAYLIGHSPKDRVDIEALVKKVYDIRSKFVHHGQRPTDMETLQCFMEKVWELFLHLLLNASTIKTKNEMIDTLKQVKYR